LSSASGLQKNAVHSLSLVVSSFLAPLSFGLAGLRLSIWSVCEGNMSMLLHAVIAVACIAKLLGVYFGALACGLPPALNSSRWKTTCGCCGTSRKACDRCSCRVSECCPTARSEVLEGVRSDDLRSAANPNATDQTVLFEVAHGLERTVWLLHRFALLLP